MTDAIDIYRYAETSDIEEFIRGLDSGSQARLNAKIAALRENGFVLLGSNLLTDTKLPHIKEVRVNGRVAVRMLVCRGPVDGKKELTLLLGAVERDNKYVPKDALGIADGRRQRVAEDPDRRRVKYEHKRRTTGNAAGGH